MVRVAKIIEKIRSNTFDPDASRAEFMLNQLHSSSSEVILSQTEVLTESEEDVEIQPKAGMRSRYSLNKKKKSPGSSREKKPVLVKNPPPQIRVPPSEERKVT